MGFYEILVFVHVFSAIIGMGPGFVMIFVVKHASTMTELKHAYFIRGKLHVFTLVGGTLLLITGLWMGFLNTYLFAQGWYWLSLILFMIALACGPLLLSPRSKPMKDFLKRCKGEEIPKEYYLLSGRLFAAERLENSIFLVIIGLMILKPF
ncbi:DUF2269 family protein [Virgibacillus sediminis]|uniref:DUF2269 family protein n=1 Tax=Virgibacillus sediminis TaxID=202260 RepID=A0ABV7A3R9_9BACI